MSARILLLALFPLAAFASQPFPRNDPGRSVAENSGGVFTLKNELISASWSGKDGHLRPVEIEDLLNKRRFPQANREAFRFATSDAAQPTEKQTWLGFEIDGDAIQVRSSTNGRGWRTLARVPNAGFPGKPSLVRLGKLDKNGGLTDYPDSGPSASPRFDHFILGDGDKTLAVDEFDAISPVWTPRVSTKPGAEITSKDGWLTVTAPANCATFLERKFPVGVTAVSCQIDQADDQGLSWGPGLALVWKGGESIVVNIRKDGACSVIANGAEQVIGTPFLAVANYNIIVSDLKITEGPKLIDLPAEAGNPREGSRHAGKAILAKLRDEKTGLAVMWRAVLRDGSNYIREELTLASTTAPLTLTGIQMLDHSVPGAKKSGTVPGSPVVAGNLFFGAEIPVYSSEIDGRGVTSGFACTYPLSGKELVNFSSVMGVVPDGQIRRGFQYYLERERARPAKAYLLYNGWYDAAVSEGRFLEVINVYNRELIQKRGVAMDGFVIDDGWDDPQSTFWGWKNRPCPTDSPSSAPQRRMPNPG